ncbi:MAG TPA: low molecular weight protein arginine phosphatase [Clostridia bacterium]|nr:low molecular weight protein arginine phosphatase [Clostridia bacterium]
MKITFVCTGNTCRSCMAEGIFRATAENRPDKMSFTAMSRGIFANDGEGASQHSVKVLATLWNIDISLHKAKMLNSTDVDLSDLILTATRSHRDALKQMYPNSSKHIFTLKEYINPDIPKNDKSLDISDPYGLPYDRYEACAREIYDCINLLINKLTKTA